MHRYGLTSSLALDHTYRTDQRLFGGGISVVIDGFVITGQTLTAYTLAGATYQWKRNSVNISGATSSTYAVTPDDEGNAITCDVVVNGQTLTSNSLSNWSPLDLPSIEQISDPEDASTFTISSGTKISRVDDRADSAMYVEQTTSSLQPQLVTSALNGLKAFDFTTNSSYMNESSQSTRANLSVLSVYTSNSAAEKRVAGYERLTTTARSGFAQSTDNTL